MEQRSPGSKPAPELVISFDGLGADFSGPQGTAAFRNPSDNSLGVGRDHVVQIVNSRMAVFTKAGAVLYGPVETRNVFRGFGGPCEMRNNGDAVVRYDQLADRWLIVMPIFTRGPVLPNAPAAGRRDDPARRSMAGRPGQPGAATPLYRPPRPSDSPPGTARPAAPPREQGAYAMCYALSTGPDPMGAYHRYEFVRPLFPDYPRPAVWPDGYYVPTSTGDEVIEKHACVVDRTKMLAGADATEQCIIVAGVNFLNNADLDGTQLPPSAPRAS